MMTKGFATFEIQGGPDDAVTVETDYAVTPEGKVYASEPLTARTDRVHFGGRKPKFHPIAALPEGAEFIGNYNVTNLPR